MFGGFGAYRPLNRQLQRWGAELPSFMHGSRRWWPRPRSALVRVLDRRAAAGLGP